MKSEAPEPFDKPTSAAADKPHPMSQEEETKISQDKATSILELGKQNLKTVLKL